jgi:hypothetical protein
MRRCLRQIQAGRNFRSRAVGVGPLRKHAGGMFLGSDRSGYAARSNLSRAGNGKCGKAEIRSLRAWDADCHTSPRTGSQ